LYDAELQQRLHLALKQMTRKEIDSAIQSSNSPAQLAGELETLAKRDRRSLIDLVISKLNKRDSDYNRVVKSLLEMVKE
jgi:hypothetical protein